MNIKFPLNITFGIVTEILYSLSIMLAALVICLAVTLKL